MLDRLVACLVTSGAKILTGAQCQWLGCGPHSTQRIYFANHSSHLDFILLWSALPAQLRRQTRPVAAADYWDGGGLRRFLATRVFHAVTIQRGGSVATVNPLQPMLQALDEGSSLILFPEGTRSDGERAQPFRSGIFHMAKLRPHVELVPVWIENCYRVMPKGTFLPVPLLCSLRFGSPVQLQIGEHRDGFLERLRITLEALRWA